MRIFSYSTYSKERIGRKNNDVSANYWAHADSTQNDINKDIEEFLSNSTLTNDE